jgi:hypothetical protein
MIRRIEIARKDVRVTCHSSQPLNPVTAGEFITG